MAVDSAALGAERSQAVAPPPMASTIADPGPLGLSAFALTTFFLSAANAGWISEAGEPAVLGVALFYGGIVQVFAGMWEFAKGNTFGATAFSSYGAFWLSLWYLLVYAKPEDVKGVGWFLLGWTIFTVIMWLASLRTNTALLATFTVLLVTFACLSINDLQGGGGGTFGRLGGYLGVVTAFLAWYAAAAGVVNNTHKRTVLPTWPRA
ncbi:MAG TPA: acetate uptake transporter [Dermatophilaceae bacterium]|nr:acetate uptake transporter [Dermatophilaceae bacterium]